AAEAARPARNTIPVATRRAPTMFLSLFSCVFRAAYGCAATFAYAAIHAAIVASTDMPSAQRDSTHTSIGLQQHSTSEPENRYSCCVRFHRAAFSLSDTFQFGRETTRSLSIRHRRSYF